MPGIVIEGGFWQGFDQKVELKTVLVFYYKPRLLCSTIVSWTAYENLAFTGLYIDQAIRFIARAKHKW